MAIAITSRAFGLVSLALFACSSTATNGSSGKEAGSGGSTLGGAGGWITGGTAGAGGTSSDASDQDAEADGCVPVTCQDLPAACGDISDGCGNMTTCSPCPVPSVCKSNKCCSPAFGVPEPGEMGQTGSLCNLTYGESQDDQAVGLDYDGGGYKLLNAHYVSACVRFNFGEGNKWSDVVVRARTVGQACTVACTICGQANNIAVIYRSNDGVTYDFAVQHAFGTAFEDFAVNLTAASQYVMVCRGAYTGAYRDLEVDAVHTADCP